MNASYSIMLTRQPWEGFILLPMILFCVNILKVHALSSEQLCSLLNFEKHNYCAASLFRLVFRSSSTAMEWAHRNKYFHLLSKGVERDGWKFVLLARFSPVPSYVINYALAATNVGFMVDFLLPTVIGCLPMILQNTSIGSLAGAAVASASGSRTSSLWSYLFPLLGILSSILISWRIKKYSTQITLVESSPPTHSNQTQTISTDTKLTATLKKTQQTTLLLYFCLAI